MGKTIEISNKLLEWQWYDDLKVSRLFIYLVLKANHEEIWYKGNLIKKGEIYTNRRLLAKETNLSEQNIRTCLSKLESTNEIKIEANNRYSKITIMNKELIKFN